MNGSMIMKTLQLFGYMSGDVDEIWTTAVVNISGVSDVAAT